MKYILSLFILLSFSFVTFADDTDILIDDLSAGTEIILDDNTTDNNDISQEISVDETEIEIDDSATIDEESLPGADLVDVPVQEVQQPEIQQLEVQPPVPAPVKTEQKTTQPQQKDSPETIYTVQLGAFKARERAFAFHWKISKKISNTRVDVPNANNKLYRVCCGTFPNYAEAKAKADKLKNQSIKCFVAKTTPIKK